jgi:hypothetical protein
MAWTWSTSDKIRGTVLMFPTAVSFDSDRGRWPEESMAFRKGTLAEAVRQRLKQLRGLSGSCRR